MYKKSKKLLVWCLVLSMVLTQMVFTNAAFAAGSNRLSGLNRYETALRISQNGWTAASTEYAVIANGENFPDALSAAPLAKKYNAPILLTEQANLTVGVLEELNRVGAKNVFIVGGEGAVAKAVEDTLKAAGKTVTRLAGASRYETALKVAEQVGAANTVVVANGENYPDALSIAPIAAAKGWPILLTDANSMDAAVKAYIGSKKAFVIGGPGAVSDAVLNSLSGAERVFGADRYATNVAVMSKFAADLSFVKVLLATGENFADALAGAVLAAKFNAPVVLVGAEMAKATESFIDSKVTSATEVIALGGPAVVPESAVTAVGGGTQDLAISSISTTTMDGRNLKISFNRPVAPISKTDISVVHKASELVIGVESVEMASDNMSANVKFLEESVDYTTDQGYVQPLETYVVTVRAEGRTLAVDYTRPGFAETRILSVDTEDRTINSWKVPADVDVDFQAVLGRTLYVWFNEDLEVIKVTPKEEQVKYDAVEITPSNDKDQIKLITEDKKYSVVTDSEVLAYVDGTEVDFDGIADGTKFDYAKLVYDKAGKVKYMYLYNWDNFMVVEKVEGNIVYGYGDEIDVEDYAIVKDGKTLAAKDMKQGDVFFYSDREDYEFGEVFNKTVSGDVSDIYADRVTVGGTDYKAFNANINGGNGLYAKYVNEDGDIKTLNVDEDEFQDIVEAMQDAGQVTVALDRRKAMVYLSGDLNDLVKTSAYAFVTDDSTLFNERGTNKWTFDILNASGEEVSYDVKASDVAADDDDDLLVENDGETATAWSTDATPEVGDNSDVVLKNAVLQVKEDKDGALDQVRLLDVAHETDQFKTTNKYYDGNKIADDVVVFLAETYYEDLASGDEDVDDITITTYGDLDFDYIDDAYFYSKDNKIVAIVVAESSRKSDATDYQSVMTDNSVKVAGEEIWKLPLIIDGAKVSLMTKDGLTAADDADKHEFVDIAVNDSTGKVDSIAVVTTDTRVIMNVEIVALNTADKEITLDVDGEDVVLRLGSDCFIANADDSYKVMTMTSLKKGDNVRVLRVSNGSQYLSAIVKDN